MTYSPHWLLQRMFMKVCLYFVCLCCNIYVNIIYCVKLWLPSKIMKIPESSSYTYRLYNTKQNWIICWGCKQMSGHLSQRIVVMFLCLISDQCVINTPSSTVMLLSFDGNIFPKYSTLLLSRPKAQGFTYFTWSTYH